MNNSIPKEVAEAACNLSDALHGVQKTMLPDPPAEILLDVPTKSDRVSRLVGEIENATYYGFNLRIELMRLDEEAFARLEHVFEKIEAARPRKESNNHLSRC